MLEYNKFGPETQNEDQNIYKFWKYFRRYLELSYSGTVLIVLRMDNVLQCLHYT